MALTFKVYEGSATLTEIGTVASVVGKKGTLAFIPGNLKNTAKRVAVVLENAKGESTVVACSKAVSDDVRGAIAKKVAVNTILSIISKLMILENDDEQAFICAPAGEATGLETFTIEELSKEKVGYESFLAF